MRAEVVTPNKQVAVLSPDELKRLTRFFSLLIQIDHRIKKGGVKNASSKTNGK